MKLNAPLIVNEFVYEFVHGFGHRLIKARLGKHAVMLCFLAGAAQIISPATAQAIPVQTKLESALIGLVAPSEDSETSESVAQVTSVSQLSDVKPIDWAFQALQSLVERYGCIAGYPDKTYRGNRAMTRYEFAAGLNACMDRINDLIAASTADSAKKEDLATIRKLQEQFSAELATLRGRVDGIESRTAMLEKQQFSPTTKLSGEAIFSIATAYGGYGGGNAAFLSRILVF